MTHRRILSDEVLDDLHADYARGYSGRELVAVARRRHGIEIHGATILAGFHRDPKRWPTRRKGSPGSTRGFRASAKTRRRVEELVELYHSGLGLKRTADAYNARHGTRLRRQSVHELFRRHAPQVLRKLGRPALSDVREELGLRFTRDRDGYWRATTGSRRHLHRLVWERANGPVPEGHVLVFLDGDADHCDLDNIACVTRSEQISECARTTARFEPATCLECDQPLVPHERETPSAFNRRVFCGVACRGRWTRGAPRGSRPSERRQNLADLVCTP